MLFQGEFLFPENAKGKIIMPKMKTRRAAAKRYKVTGSGKVMYKKQGTRHILTKKTTKRKRNLRHSGVLSDPETKKAKILLPYSF